MQSFALFTLSGAHVTLYLLPGQFPPLLTMATASYILLVLALKLKWPPSVGLYKLTDGVWHWMVSGYSVHVYTCRPTVLVVQHMFVCMYGVMEKMGFRMTQDFELLLPLQVRVGMRGCSCWVGLQWMIRETEQ